MEMSKLKVPIIAIVIGEGASGGALGIGICDRMLMLENSWYSVITPEGCASILWRDAGKASQAAEALKLTSADLKSMGICDRIVEEPVGGAHSDPEKMFVILKKVILEELKSFDNIPVDSLFEDRIKKYDNMGSYTYQE